MIRSNASRVIGEVFFNHTRTQSDGTQHGAVARSMIGQPQNRIRENYRICLKYVEVNMLKILDASG